MPFNENGVYYQSPIDLEGATITPVLISADIALPATPFSLEAARTLFAELRIHEHYQTALAGANDDLVYIARTPGNQTVRVAYIDPAANNAALGIVVAGEDITVNLATGAGGAITSTAAQIKAAIEASAAANALVVVLLAASNTGAGVVTAMAQQTLAGPFGTTPTLDVTLKHGLDTETTATNAAFAQKTAAGTEFKVFENVASYGQWDFNIGGTSPVFAASIVAQYRP